MAGYPKIWTTIISEDWFVEMNYGRRGVYLQLLLLAKMHGDSGNFTYRTFTQLAEALGGERSTVGKILGDFSRLGLISVKSRGDFSRQNENCEKSNADFSHFPGKQAVTVTVHKYREYQEIRTQDELKDKRKSKSLIKELNKELERKSPSCEGGNQGNQF